MALKYHFDAIAAIDHAEKRSDAEGLNAFFSQQLVQIRTQLIEKVYPEFKARNFVPIKNDINPGAEVYSERHIDETGEAEFATSGSDNANMVEVTGASTDTYKMLGIDVAYGWDLQEARNAQFAGMDLDVRKASAARRAIERKIDKTLLIGGVAGGTTLQGLFSLAGDQAPFTFSPDITGWADESSDDIYRNLMAMASYGYEQSKEIEQPDTFLMPTTFKRLLMNRRMGDANNSSILKFFLDSQDFIKNIGTSHYLEASGGHAYTTNNLLVMYKKDPEMMEGLVNEFEQLPPEYRFGRVVTKCMARVGGLLSRRPKSVTYAVITQ